MRDWRANGLWTLLGGGSSLGGLLLAACRGSCSSCYGCVGGGIFGLVVVCGARFRKNFGEPVSRHAVTSSQKSVSRPPANPGRVSLEPKAGWNDKA